MKNKYKRIICANFILFSIILLYCLFSVRPCHAKIVTFQWDANTESNLAGYRLYQSNQSGKYVFGNGSVNFVAEIPESTETYTINLQEGGRKYFVLTAFNTEGLESVPSNEVDSEGNITVYHGDGDSG